MEETTFRSQGLKLVVDGKYNMYKIDFDSHAAKDWKNKFPIHSVPAFLVFDKNGEMVKRVDKSLTSTQIIDLLKKPEEFSFITNTTTSTYQYEYAAGPYKNDFYNWNKDSEKLLTNAKIVEYTENVVKQEVIEKEVAFINESVEVEKPTTYKFEEQKLSFYLTPQDALVVEEFMDGVVKISDNSSASIETKSTPKQPSSTTKMEEIAKYFYNVSNLYHSKITKKQPEKSKEPVEFGKKMYRIQFGVFADINDANGLVAELRRQQPHPIFTLYETSSGNPVYRVVVGKFSSYDEASMVKDEIYIKGLSAMVIEI